MEPAMENVSQREFHLFSKLPAELRHSIILLALRPRYPYVGGWRTRAREETQRQPGIAQVNRESRAIFQSLYTRLFSVETLEDFNYKPPKLLAYLPIYAMLPQQVLRLDLMEWEYSTHFRPSGSSWLYCLTQEARENTKHAICGLHSKFDTLHSTIQDHMDAFPFLKTLIVYHRSQYINLLESEERLDERVILEGREGVMITFAWLEVMVYVWAKRDAEVQKPEYMDKMSHKK